MGCTSSQVLTLQPSYIQRKPELWIILGGPGSNKAKIIQYLVRDYKFMYLSLFEILQFEKQRPTVQADLIKKTILEKKDFSTELVTQLVKKAIASLGPRRYLIDGYPRNQTDMDYFEKQPFIKQITQQKIIHIQVSVQKMKLTGMEAKKGDKRPQEELQKQVNSVIEEYKKQQEVITQFYKAKNAIISVPERDTEDETYNQLRLELQNLPRFKQANEGDARVFFASFTPEQDQAKYTFDEFTKKFGMIHLNYTTLIQECKQKLNNDSKYLQECDKKKQLPSSQFVIYLFRKQFQKKDFIGNFLVTGFPRNINDAVLWEKSFGWEVGVEGYLEVETIDQGKLASGGIESNEKVTANKKVLHDFYQKQSKFTKISTDYHVETRKKIQQYMTLKGVPKRISPNMPPKIVFMSTINQEFNPKLQKYGGSISVHHNPQTNMVEQKLNPPQKVDVSHIKEINILYSYENQAKENGLYSELIRSYLVSGMPLPGYLAVRILLKNLRFLIQTQGPKNSRPLMILVKGFPNSAEQISTWNQEVGQNHPVTSVMYFQTNQDKIKQILTKHKVEFTQQTVDKIKKNSLKLEEFLKPNELTGHKMNDEKHAQEFVTYLI